jgi:DNA-binding LytR/AlgR family response regulator
MSLKRVIIVEDSVTAAEDLIADLAKHLDIEVIGVFDTTKSALPILRLGQVDGVFLDIAFELSGTDTDGLELARQIGTLSQAPWIIFITGRKEHALDAINLLPPNILYGYLLKPYTEIQLTDAINKVRQMPPPQPTPETQRIPVKHRRITEVNRHIENERILTMIDIADIRYIHQDHTVNVYLTSGEVLKDVDINLTAWEEKLLSKNIDYFQKIHRQTIVNLKCANGIKSDLSRFEGFLALFRDCKDELEIGGKYLRAYREAIITGKRVATTRVIDRNMADILYVTRLPTNHEEAKTALPTSMPMA